LVELIGVQLWSFFVRRLIPASINLSIQDNRTAINTAIRRIASYTQDVTVGIMSE